MTDEKKATSKGEPPEAGVHQNQIHGTTSAPGADLSRNKYTSPQFETYPDGKIRIARKDHVCDFSNRCKNIIKTGDPYFESGESNIDRAGGFGSYRFCKECAEIKTTDDAENHKLGTDRLIGANGFGLTQAELYKTCLVSVTKTLKSYAETFHFRVHGKAIPFVTCQDPLCVQARKEIDYVILIVAGGPK